MAAGVTEVIVEKDQDDNNTNSAATDDTKKPVDNKKDTKANLAHQNGGNTKKSK